MNLQFTKKNTYLNICFAPLIVAVTSVFTNGMTVYNVLKLIVMLVTCVYLCVCTLHSFLSSGCRSGIRIPNGFPQSVFKVSQSDNTI